MTVPLHAATCSGCGTEVASGLLACPVCHRLVYGAELRQLATGAREAEERGDLTTALGTWRKTLELLPVATSQRATIDAQMKRLSAMVDGRAPKPEASGKKAGALATTGAVGAVLLKSKAILFALLANGKFLLLGLLKLPTLLSMVVYANLVGGRTAGVGLGIIAAIYVHEIGHVVTLRRYGIEASAPMFVPGFGALVRLKQYPTDAHEDARTGLAGPLWGLAASVFALALGAVFHWDAALTVARWSATINVFNLIPVWQLDGSRGLHALSKTERAIVGATAVAVALVTWQAMPAAVGAVVLGRSMVGTSHPTGDRGMLALFLALIVSLPAVAWVAAWLAGGA